MLQGKSYKNAHAQALARYGVAERDLYPPEILEEFSEWFFKYIEKSGNLDFSENSRRFSLEILPIEKSKECGDILYTIEPDFIIKEKFCIIVEYKIETGRIGGVIQFSFYPHQENVLNFKLDKRLTEDSNRDEDIKYFLSGIKQFKEIYKPLPYGNCDIYLLSSPLGCVGRISHKMYSSRIILACLHSTLSNEYCILHRIANILGFSEGYIEENYFSI